MEKTTIPEPVKLDSRICFAIAYFLTPEDAEAYDRATPGRTYNGGWFHGQPCGRDPSFDHVDQDGRKLYACTC